jgi:CBS domain-containing protein
LTVREIMTTDVECAAPETTLDEIAEMMRDRDTGAIPVVDEDELCGIITDRDIVVRCIAEGEDPKEVIADEILSENLCTIGPDAEVEQAARMMAEAQVRRLPIVENGKLVGMLSIGDIAVKHADEELAGSALENVSEGVKAGKPGQRGAAPDQKKAPAREQARSISTRQPQGIANRDAREEQQRQSEVVPIRSEEKAAGQRKPASRRKAS